MLKCGSDINERNWLQLLFYFIVLKGYGCLRYWTEFSSAVFQDLNWVFLVLHFDGNVCSWIPKVIWPRMDWYWGFLWENGFLRRLHICMDWIVHEFLNCYSFLTTSFFPMFSLRGILVCSLKLLVLCSDRTFKEQFIRLGMHCNYTFYIFVFQAICLGSSGATFWLLLKTR